MRTSARLQSLNDAFNQFAQQSKKYCISPKAHAQAKLQKLCIERLKEIDHLCF